ncbi:MAG TPA: peptidoglycan DD-metalloendopeptidase family protein [Planococcus sp. (in: firmicutes)]|nr:peptidoglycan DD-metalloendopeptidase family protein [Planococcus sp. (in: firmicutes)]
MKKITEKSFSIDGSNLIKIAVSVFLVMGLSTNPATAENPGHEGFETVYHIYNDGNYVGAVSEGEGVEDLVDAKIAAAGKDFKELDLEADESFSMIAEQVFEPSVKDEQEVFEKLDEELAVKASTFALTLDGEVIAQLKDRSAYDETIRQLLLAYASPEELDQWEATKHTSNDLPELEAGQTRITSIDIEDSLSGASDQAAPEAVSTPEEATALLLAEKDITVTVEKQQKVEEGIKFETVEKKDEDLFIGNSEVEQKGKDGEKQVTYTITEKDGEQMAREAADEKVTTEPVEGVILNGAKELPSVGTGEFVWPAQGGYISSKKGQRWGREHKGIDIAQPDDFDILASDHGVVKAAGADGSFGNRVIIDHNNGFETIYAHLDSIDVEVGDKVLQGTKIGVMGTTGRSTGTHLHFEISQNGATKDPLNYVSQ